MQEPTVNVQHTSFPKSGSTWIRHIYAKIENLQSGKELDPTLETGTELVDKDGTKLRLRFPHGHQYLKTCVTGELDLDYHAPNTHVILFRDPRDVVVSFWYYATYRQKTYSGTLSDFIRGNHDHVIPENFVAKVPVPDFFQAYGLSAVINYMNAYVALLQTHKRSMDVYYEDFLGDTVDIVLKELEFLNVEVARDLLFRAVAESSFEVMKNAEASGQYQWEGLASSGLERSAKVRSGKAGGYRHEMSEADIAWCDERIEEQLTDYFGRYKKAGSSPAGGFPATPPAGLEPAT